MRVGERGGAARAMPQRQEASSALFFRGEFCRILCKGSLWVPSPPPASPIPPLPKGWGGDGGAGGVPTTPRPTPPHPSFFEAMQQNARSLCSTGGQFARVVKGVDLRSTAGNCAWVRTPQLASLPAVGLPGHARRRWCPNFAFSFSGWNVKSVA